ncbi:MULTISPECIES: hypothetical protein [Vibrio]|uniref:Uncharacterized protein n=1 Tax=Vibrio halioticoli NBRC 102217 TaxID=1219072 RepID=V5FIL0_9VIBR|nr:MULTISPECIES: hypothetical protein [Vibrio]MPW37856.1 hypothetical protein [Vibrio sp. B1Z05]GAD89656.1 hypothetical protein VHA01S_024_00510 [Vibrio halioticoli NBRC 102217]
MAFVWHSFGILSEVTKDNSYVYIKNSDGRYLKMSIGRYKESALNIYDKALTLKGQNVEVRTSQNTSNWSTQEWFSEINAL